MNAILLLEDNPETRTALVRLLEKRGAKVEAVTTNAEAIAAVQKDPSIEVALVDLMLPDGSGFQLVEYLVRNRPNVQVVVITAAMNAEGAKEFANVIKIVPKPVSNAHLLYLYDVCRLERKGVDIPHDADPA